MKRNWSITALCLVLVYLNAFRGFLKYFVFLTLIICGATVAKSQTVLINPSTSGGFESGTSFAANGWTVVNAPHVYNKFYVGTVPSGFTNRSAYISFDGGSSHSYNSDSLSVVHFYRDVTVAAGQTSMLLTFNWKAMGEPTFWDGLVVSVAPTTYVPVSDTFPVGNGGLGSPTTEVARFWNSSTVQSASVYLPSDAIGNCSGPATFRLIFTWKNDAASGTNPPLAIDNISLVSSVPGIPPSGGTFTINNTLATGGSNFNSFTAAITALNATGGCSFTSPVIFNVSAGQTFNEKPPVITVSGNPSATISFIKNGAGSNPKITSAGSVSTDDGSIVISGGDYFVFDGIDIDNSANSSMEFGYLLRSKSETNGSQNNLIKNCQVKMNRSVSLATSSAFLISTTSTGGAEPITSNLGSNSYNKLYNVSVNGALNGITLMGSILYPDIANEISGQTVRNSITNIGPSGTSTGVVRGVYLLNQSGIILSNTDITSVSGYNSNTHGLLVTGSFGNSEIKNNQIYSVYVSGSSTTTSTAYGMQLQQGITGSNTLNVYNNMISNLYTPYSSSATSARRAIGIHVGIVGGNSSQVYNIYHNSVSIGQGLAPDYSTTCFEIQNINAVYHVKNNIFSNFTEAQAGASKHYCWVSTSSTNYGASGSLSDYNDLYIANHVGVSGFVGRANTNDLTAINNWTAAMTSIPGTDLHSFSSNPSFVNNLSNLHISASIGSSPLESGGTTVGISTDIDGDLRPGPVGSLNGGAIAPDNGADEYDGILSGHPVISLNSITPSSTSLCTASNRSISVNVTITDATISTVVLNYSFNGNTQPSINMNNTSGTTWAATIPIASPVDATVTWNILATSSGGISTSYNGASYSDEPLFNVTGSIQADPSLICSGSSGSLTATLLKNGSTVVPISTISWSDGSTVVGNTNPITISPSITTTYTADITSGGCSFNPDPSIVVTVTEVPGPPITTNSSHCGSQIPTATVSSSSGTVSPVFNWYSAASGGTLLQTSSSNTFLSNVSSTSTFYVSEILPGNCESARSAITITVFSSDNISASANSTNICLGSSVTLTATNLNPIPVQNYTYTWSGSPNSGISSPINGSSVTVTPTASGTFVYSLYGVDGSCSSNAEISITVNSFMALVAPINATCNGSADGSFSLASYSCGMPPYSFSVNGSSFGPIPTNLVAGTYTIIVMDASNVQSPSQIITINQPVETISIPITNGATICQNDPSAIITANSSISDGNPASITWWTSASGGTQLGTGNNFETIGTSVLPNSNTSGIYQFYAQGQNGVCSSPGRTLATVQIKSNSSSSLTISSCDSYVLNGQTYNSSGIYTQTLVNSAGCDSILTLDLTIKHSTSSSSSVTSCNSYTWSNGITYNMSGTFSQTLVNSQGCDSIATLNLTIKYSSSSTTNIATCATYTWTNGITYTSSGSYFQNLINSVGCDSLATLVLTIVAPSSQTQNVTACNSYFWSANGQTYTSSGSHTATLTNIGGCDSVVTLNLTVNQSSSSSQTVSACNLYFWPVNNQTYTSTGIFTHSLINSKGCDSLITLNLTINHSSSSTTTINTCGSYTWTNGVTYSSSGTFSQNLINSDGCDSLATLVLTIVSPSSQTLNVTACNSYFWSANGQTYTTSGSHTVTLTNIGGCDSVLALNLIVNQSSSSSQTVSACNSYFWPVNNQIYSSSGIFTHSLINSKGCDSLITLNLTIKYPTSSSQNITSCESYTWSNGQTYYSSGTYIQNLVSANGCDSVISLHLTIHLSTYSVQNISICDSFTWSNGQTYYSSGTFTQNLENNYGCDSVATLNLTILSESSQTMNVEACGSYFWPENGQTYTTSGIRTIVLTNSGGCDSTIILNLTINQSTSSTQTEHACLSYTWTNGITYTASGTYTQQLTSTNGCDSTATLFLTIGSVNPGMDTVYSCDPYYWDANGVTYNLSGVYYADLVTPEGCDSSSTLYLFVGSAVNIVAACESYTWPVNGMIYTESGTYVDTLYDMGCEFIYFLRLNINGEEEVTEDVFACESFEWTNGITYSSSGTYYQYLQSESGCDSTVALNLTISTNVIASASDNGSGNLSSSPGYSYQWINCMTQTDIPNANSQTFIATINGTYAVIVSYSGGCSDTSNCVLIDYLDINPVSDIQFEIYPNPTWDKVTISMTLSSADIELFDENGKILQTGTIENGGLIDLSNYETGVYFLKISKDKYNNIKRVVKY